MRLLIYDYLSKTSHVCPQAEVKFIGVAYNYTEQLQHSCSLPSLANINWCAIPDGFLPTM